MHSMAIQWSPPKHRHRGALKDMLFQPPSAALNACRPIAQPAAKFDPQPSPKALSNITEVTSQIAVEKGKDVTPIRRASRRKSSQSHQADIHASPNGGCQPAVGLTRKCESARDGTDPDKFPCEDDLLSKSSNVSTLAPPDDSSVPLASSSGRVGTLLIRIHRSRSRAFIYGNMIVIGALSHQTWVSGEVLYFDVEIDNTSEKFVKRIEIQFVRTISATVGCGNAGAEIQPPIEKTNRALASWTWKKGLDGWSGVAPQTQIVKTWNPIVPAGQATTSERGVEASYGLTIILPSLLGRTASAFIPLKIIHPNSLGRLRLEQGLRHAFRAQESPEVNSGSPVKRQESWKPHTDRQLGECSNGKDALRYSSDVPRPSKENRRRSIDNKKILPRRGSRYDTSVESNPHMVFMSENPIPCASDELLTEMLSKIQKTPKKVKIKRSPRKHILTQKQQQQHQEKVRQSLLAAASSSEAAARENRRSILKPLSVIDAHCRRKSSDDVRCNTKKILSVPDQTHFARASFDDYIRVKHHGRRENDGVFRQNNEFRRHSSTRHSGIPPPPPPSPDHHDDLEDDPNDSSASEDEGDHGACKDGAASIAAGSSPSLDSADLERFLRERRSFQVARRESVNPFFKGSTGKERMQDARYRGHRSLKEQLLEESQRQYERPCRFYRRLRVQPYGDFLTPTRTEGNGDSTENRRSRHHDRSSSSKCAHPAIWKYSGHRTLF